MDFDTWSKLWLLDKVLSNQRQASAPTIGVRSGSLNCPYCSHRVAERVRYEGQNVHCPNCSSSFLCPQYEKPPEPPPPPTVGGAIVGIIASVIGLVLVLLLAVAFILNPEKVELGWGIIAGAVCFFPPTILLLVFCLLSIVKRYSEAKALAASSSELEVDRSDNRKSKKVSESQSSSKSNASFSNSTDINALAADLSKNRSSIGSSQTKNEQQKSYSSNKIPIEYDCDCGTKLRIKGELSGRKIKCPKCARPLVFPEGKTRSEMISISCRCGKEFQAKPSFAGKSFKCTKCGCLVSVPYPPHV
jgi:hypothetical protein